MHWLAQKMIDEFDAEQHIRFAFPFVRTMAADFGLYAALSWVSEVLLNEFDEYDAVRTSLHHVRLALESKEPIKLKHLDELAWSLWCRGDGSDQNCEKSICRFSWAVMDFISYENDYKFDTRYSGLNYDGRTGEQFKAACLQAATSLDLALRDDCLIDKAICVKLANDFTREIKRLESTRDNGMHVNRVFGGHIDALYSICLEPSIRS